MQKQAPRLTQVFAMVLFALSCFGLLLFLWLSFGGPVPLKPQGYQAKVSFTEATTLAEEADVRLAGVNIGKVKDKQLDRDGGRTLVTLEIDAAYAPLRASTRAILRQKTLLGETYVELTPASATDPMLPDGAELPVGNVEPTVELDEIFQTFDAETREALRGWIDEAAAAVDHGTGQDLNDALGNLDRFVSGGADVLRVMDDHSTALRQFVRNTGEVFAALTEREGELRSLISNSAQTFDAIASRDAALAESFRIFPTFLDESKATLARLETFSRETRPLVRDLQPVADDLAPTVRDLGALAPDLRRLFRDLDPLISASRVNSPQLVRVLQGAAPVVDALHPFLQELNPILSYANYGRNVLAGFLMNGAHALSSGAPYRDPLGTPTNDVHRMYLRQVAITNSRSLALNLRRPVWERGNAYIAPNNYDRGAALGTIESFDCAPAGGEVRDPVDDGINEYPPCFVQPPSLYDGNHFPALQRNGTAPLVPRPEGTAGNAPADPRR